MMLETKHHQPQREVQAQTSRTLSGTIVTAKNEVVAGASVIVRAGSEERGTVSDGEGNSI